ncbi:cation:proton antiporter domain-containing protein, partial [Staphylococcus epidermidis]|uniref:cation:proton antiporter domain-containing protein n=1 Tax=Staphylococcus epidermidis TaxID=1282 RepID=UPI0037DA0AD3
LPLPERVGPEYILPPFLPRLLLSLLKPNQHILQKLHSFPYPFFIPIFFIILPLHLHIPTLIKQPSFLLIIPLLIFS